VPGLTDRSHRPHRDPGQLAAEVEARVCELRRTHPRWGSRRLVHELRRLGVTPLPSRSTVYRVLVRHNLVAAGRITGDVCGGSPQGITGAGSARGRCSCGKLDVMGTAVFIKGSVHPGWGGGGQAHLGYR
jgi:hypothetical protein